MKFYFLLFFTYLLYYQVGIGTTGPKPSAMLEISSAQKEFLPPRMSLENIMVVDSPIEGLMIYCTDCTVKS